MNEDIPINIWSVFQPSHYDIYCWTHALDEYIPQVCGEIPIEETTALDDARIVSWWMCCKNPKRLNKRIKQIILIPVNQQILALYYVWDWVKMITRDGAMGDNNLLSTPFPPENKMYKDSIP